MTSEQISVILLLGAGAFIFIALSELPEALGVSDGTSKRGGKAVTCLQGRKLASFLLGALLIDQHCEADGHDH